MAEYTTKDAVNFVMQKDTAGFKNADDSGGAVGAAGTGS